MPKRSLRSQLLAQRRSLGHDSWCVSSRAAQLNLLSLDEYAAADCIALYAPAHNETDTELLLAAAFRAGKRVLFPAVCGQQMVFRRVERLEELQKGAFGILEPCRTGADHQADEADLIVIPGVGFDLSGHRIGYGKGFYDRFLHHPDCSAHLIGLCHDFQLIEELIPADAHDIPMEIIVSDRRIVRIGRAGEEK
ncbi:MAG TPA: 5-formyltetrahydrofolate cyclo-ligase [Desulfuromonadales bacterium]|nr:5-formyltetrahydrofolate cyclo-ligase [Desulfuromonadales bacterium]